MDWNQWRTAFILEPGKYDARPLHATNSEAQMRVRMQWTTPVGPVEDVRDFHLAHRGDQWKVVWDELRPPTFPPRSSR